MKKFTALLLMAFICSSGFSFGKKAASDCVKGTIAYYGNEPFVSIVIKADDGNVYALKGDEKLIRSLKNEFGKNIKFYGKLEVYEKKPGKFQKNDGTFTLEYFKVSKR